MEYTKYKIRVMAICKIKDTPHSFWTKIARLLIECDAEGFTDWQCDGGFYHDEGEFNVDWSTARPVHPDEYEVIMGSTDCVGRFTVQEIVEVFEDTVLIEDGEIIEVE